MLACPNRCETAKFSVNRRTDTDPNLMKNQLIKSRLPKRQTEHTRVSRTLIELLLVAVPILSAQSEEPVLFFSDLTSGPRTGNTDASGGRTSGEDGAIVTLWGRHLGRTPGGAQVYCNGAEAASYYASGPANQPANLSAYHQMEMIVFQISHLAQDGPGGIQVVTGGKRSNALPFRVRPGNIHFVTTTGNDATGTGTWAQPWETIMMAVDTMAAGDIVYVGDGVTQTNESDASAAVNLSSSGEPGNPKALVAYPGATVHVGSPAIERSFFMYDWNQDGFTTHWVMAKFHITTGQLGAPAYHGFRVVGNYITAPNGDGMDGAIDVQGNDVFVLGNELDRVGSTNCSKLYHAIYAKGFRTDDPPRAPTESNREIAWNYVHDSAANRAINIYSEQVNSAFLERHSVHDNVIVNQRGDGIMLGYYVTGENWIYNNLVIRAGRGPEWPDGESYHTGIRISAGHEAVSGTVVHCYNNTLYACGWSDAVLPGETGHLLVNPEALPFLTLNFINNLIYSTGEPYLAEESAALAPRQVQNCWYGDGSPPAWDISAINADPRFVDAPAGNFALAAGSPCINAGADVSSVVRRDLGGSARPQGSAIDIGAFEYGEPSAESRLTAASIGNLLVLTWSGSAGTRLQRTPSLAPPTWADVDGSEGVSTLGLKISGGHEFFRLIRQ